MDQNSELNLPILPIGTDSLSILNALAGPIVLRRWLVDINEEVKAGYPIAELGLVAGPLPSLPDSSPVIVSPEEGIVVNRHYREGERIRPGEAFGTLRTFTVDRKYCVHPIYEYISRINAAHFRRRQGDYHGVVIVIGLAGAILAGIVVGSTVGPGTGYFTFVILGLLSASLGVAVEKLDPLIRPDRLGKISLQAENLEAVETNYLESHLSTFGTHEAVIRIEQDRDRRLYSGAMVRK